MKKIILGFVLLASMTTFGQSIKFGLKGGLNFGSTGDLTTVINITDNQIINGDDQVGFHIGAFTKLKFAGVFVQPELVYTRLNTEFESSGSKADYNFSKLDIPVLLGFELIGPLNVKLGPAFQVVLNNELDGITGIDVQDPENTFTIGYQVGAGVALGKLGIDLRYEGSFQDNDALSDNIQSGTGFIVDSRPSQFILSLSYELGGKGVKK